MFRIFKKRKEYRVKKLYIGPPFMTHYEEGDVVDFIIGMNVALITLRDGSRVWTTAPVLVEEREEK